MHIRDEDVLDAIIVLCGHADDAAAPAPLVAVGVEVNPFDVVRGGERDQHRFILDEVLPIEGLGCVPDPGPPLITVTGTDVDEFLFDLGEDARLACEDSREPLNLLYEGIALVQDLLVLERRKPAELHL